MTWNGAVGILEIGLGTLFIVAAFSNRWRAMIASLNPYSSKLMVSIVSVGIGLIQFYAGIRNLLPVLKIGVPHF